tara:strand:+ start:122 stop:592 length:471 start_codon:yes stop_codon:yes gene_type:complete
MLVICESCNKKFKIDDDLIPESGRLLQCGSCEHKWFFQKKNNEVQNIERTVDKTNIKKINPNTKKKVQKIQKFNIKKSDEPYNNIDEPLDDEDKKVKKINFFKTFIVLIISIIALILILDTFKEPLSAHIPNIKITLTNLYLTLNDISLFLKDLIK